MARSPAKAARERAYFFVDPLTDEVPGLPFPPAAAFPRDAGPALPDAFGSESAAQPSAIS